MDRLLGSGAALLHGSTRRSQRTRPYLSSFDPDGDRASELLHAVQDKRGDANPQSFDPLPWLQASPGWCVAYMYLICSRVNPLSTSETVQILGVNDCKVPGRPRDHQQPHRPDTGASTTPSRWRNSVLPLFTPRIWTVSYVIELIPSGPLAAPYTPRTDA
jgi:hypothetical protein